MSLWCVLYPFGGTVQDLVNIGPLQTVYTVPVVLLFCLSRYVLIIYVFYCKLSVVRIFIATCPKQFKCIFTCFSCNMKVFLLCFTSDTRGYDVMYFCMLGIMPMHYVLQQRQVFLIAVSLSACQIINTHYLFFLIDKVQIGNGIVLKLSRLRVACLLYTSYLYYQYKLTRPNSQLLPITVK